MLADCADGGPAVDWNIADDPSVFSWLGAFPRMHVLPPPPWGSAEAGRVRIPPVAPPAATVLWDDDELRRLASLDALHRHERVVREGWLFLCGPATMDDRVVRICIPLLSRPVRLTWTVDRFVLSPAGDLELTPAVPRGALSARLEEHIPLEDEALRRWCGSVLDAMGVHANDVVDPATNPTSADVDHLVISPGCALYLDRSVAGLDLGPTLRTWAAVDGIEDTALASLYSLGPAARLRPAANKIWSPFPLTPRQQDAVLAARSGPITVVRGSPGTGKSHTVVAAAVDAVDQRLTVLVATGSDHATEVLAELLNRRPGPTPVLFGNAEQRDRLAAQLTSHVARGETITHITASARSASEAARRDERLEEHIAALLRHEHLAAGWPSADEDLALSAELAPGLLDPDIDIDELARLDHAVRSAPFRRSGPDVRDAIGALRALAGAADTVPIPTLSRLVFAAQSRRAKATLESEGGTSIGSLWDDLTRADTELALAVGGLISDKARYEEFRSAGGRQGVASLASVLRGPRGARRRHLRNLDATDLLQALPLWVGTLRDIDDLLPAQPGLFDLVILDEAAQITQSQAASTLLRGRRALVVGDPGQLVVDADGTVGSVDLIDALSAAGQPPPARHIDIARDSVFDLAAAESPTIVLDEHFRSPPHLIGFSLEEIGTTPMFLATRHPRNECQDNIDVIRVGGTLDGDGVNTAEVDALRDLVADMAAHGATSIGVIAPLAAQANALEAMLLQQFPPQTVRAMGLRVGTVEDLQGAERDVIIASLGITDHDDATRVAIVEEPHRFNVMITRARTKMIVITSLTPGPDGLARRYLAYADKGLPPTPSTEPSDPWTRALRDELNRLGLATRTNYPAGRWTIDLVLGDGESATAVETITHPEGPAAHIERHRQLVRMGWHVIDAFPTRWEFDPIRAAIALVTDLAIETAR